MSGTEKLTARQQAFSPKLEPGMETGMDAEPKLEGFLPKQ